MDKLEFFVGCLVDIANENDENKEYRYIELIRLCGVPIDQERMYYSYRKYLVKEELIIERFDRIIRDFLYKLDVNRMLSYLDYENNKFISKNILKRNSKYAIVFWTPDKWKPRMVE